MADGPIVVVGSFVTDMVIQVDRIPNIGETLLGGKFLTNPGGKGANQAVAAARAGATVHFVGRVGTDSFGDKAAAALRSYRINVDCLLRDKFAATGVALIFVAKNGANSIGVAPGANFRLTPADITKAARLLRSASVLVMQLETPLATVQAAARVAERAGVPVILNPAPTRKLPASLLKDISIFTPNEHEAEVLTGIKVTNEAAAKKAASNLMARGVQTVVMTLGERGAYVANAAEQRLIPGFTVKAVDTTGAGDVFNGALAAALSEGQALAAAVRFANAAAAISVTRVGTSVSAPTRKEIERLLAKGKI